MITVEDVEAILGRVLKPEAFDQWWVTPIPSHQNKTPFDIWSEDGSYAVYSIVLGYLDPGFS